MISKNNINVKLAYERGYRVLECGSVVNEKGKILAGGLNKKKYRCITIRVKGVSRHPLVHKMQAYQKYGDAMFEEGIQVRHLNGDSLDNSFDNIAIGTCSDNQMDKPEYIRKKSAIAASSKIRKFSDDVVSEIKNDHKEGLSYTKLMKKYNISSKGTLSFLINNVYVTSI